MATSNSLQRARASSAAPRAALAAVACALLLGSPANARAENSVTAFGGWRASGTLEDSVAQHTVRLRDTASYALALDLTYDETRQLEFFASHQRTSLTVMPIGGTTSLRLPVSVSYFHFGGTNYFDGPAGTGPYVAGGLGLTRLTPGLDGFESETRASLSLGAGYAFPLGRYVALRVEGRGYWTLVNSSGSLFCSGGCTITIKGDTLQQIEMMVGITARF
jgi:hypothetical protein